MFTGRAQNPKRRGGMHIQHGLPLFIRVALDRSVPDIAGVVHNDVQSTQTIQGGIDDTLAKIRRRHIAVAGDGAATRRRDQINGFRSRLVVQIIDHHRRTGLGQADCDRTANAPARSGDDSNLAQ